MAKKFIVIFFIAKKSIVDTYRNVPVFFVFPVFTIIMWISICVPFDAIIPMQVFIKYFKSWCVVHISIILQRKSRVKLGIDCLPIHLYRQNRGIHHRYHVNKLHCVVFISKISQKCFTCISGYNNQ